MRGIKPGLLCWTAGDSLHWKHRPFQVKVDESERMPSGALCWYAQATPVKSLRARRFGVMTFVEPSTAFPYLAKELYPTEKEALSAAISNADAEMKLALVKGMEYLGYLSGRLSEVRKQERGES